MTTETRGSSLGMLGLLVLGGSIGFTAFMAMRARTIDGLVQAVQSDLHMVAVSGLVVALGVTLSAYGFWD